MNKFIGLGLVSAALVFSAPEVGLGEQRAHEPSDVGYAELDTGRH